MTDNLERKALELIVKQLKDYQVQLDKIASDSMTDRYGSRDAIWALRRSMVQSINIGEEVLDKPEDKGAWFRGLTPHQKALIQALESQITLDDARMVLDAFLDERLVEACQLLHEAMSVKNVEHVDQISMGQPFVFTLRVRGVVVDRKQFKGSQRFTIHLDSHRGRGATGLDIASDEILSAIVVAAEGN